MCACVVVPDRFDPPPSLACSHSSTNRPIPPPTNQQFIGAGLEYKPSIGDLGNKAVWDSFSADADGWVPPAILSAARDIQNMKNSFGNIVASGTRGLLADSIVTVRAWGDAGGPRPLTS